MKRKPKPPDTNPAAFADAAALMERRDWSAAKDTFLAVAEHSTTDKVLSLYRAAECSFYQGAQHDAETIDLTRRLMAERGGMGKAHVIRGLVYDRQGNKPQAQKEWESGTTLNDPTAAKLLASMGR